MRTEMRVHFLHRHFQNTVVILEGGNPPHPQCPRCDMLMLWKALNGRHTSTAYCAKGMERKRRWMAAEEMRKSAARVFQAYGRPLETVSFFKYLGCILMALGDNWTEVVVNLRKARNIWARLYRIL